MNKNIIYALFAFAILSASCSKSELNDVVVKPIGDVATTGGSNDSGKVGDSDSTTVTDYGFVKDDDLSDPDKDLHDKD